MTFKHAHLTLVCLAATSILGLESRAQASPIILNGSFESTTLTNSGRFNTTDVADWTTSSYTFLVFPGTAQTGIGGGVKLYAGFSPDLMPATSPDGGNFVAADGAYQTGKISQTMNGLTAGLTYNVSFYQAGAQQQGFNGNTTDRFEVFFGAQTKYSDLLTNPSHGFQPWEKQTLSFTATSTTEVLSFLAVGTPNGVPPFTLLDGVSVTSTPEPAFMGLIGAGLLALGAFRRKSKTRP
ncbi:MAG: PEP-CTERM sorting domain-containing protein [Candidatus Sulfopaludibacter sp.]|nr:PEP-CTERM sorting domain-containing protein [Candidatus Sulfopaludibacter sp.]